MALTGGMRRNAPGSMATAKTAPETIRSFLCGDCATLLAQLEQFRGEGHDLSRIGLGIGPATHFGHARLIERKNGDGPAIFFS